MNGKQLAKFIVGYLVAIVISIWIVYIAVDALDGNHRWVPLKDAASSGIEQSQYVIDGNYRLVTLKNESDSVLVCEIVRYDRSVITLAVNEMPPSSALEHRVWVGDFDAGVKIYRSGLLVGYLVLNELK